MVYIDSNIRKMVPDLWMLAWFYALFNIPYIPACETMFKVKFYVTLIKVFISVL